MSSRVSLLGGRLVRKPCTHSIDEKKDKLWHCRMKFIWAQRCHVHSQFRVKMKSSRYLIQRTGFFSFNLFYWSIVDLQYCVNFYCAANRFSYTHVYTHLFFSILFHMFYHRILNTIPWTIRWAVIYRMLFIRSTYTSSVHCILLYCTVAARPAIINCYTPSRD